MVVTVTVQARRKEFRVGPGKIGWSSEGASTIESPGAFSPGNFEI